MGENDRIKHDNSMQPGTVGSGTPTYFAKDGYSVRNGNRLRYFSSGSEVFLSLADDLHAATKSICITTWGMNPLLNMKYGSADNLDSRYILKEILESRARAGTKIRIVIWRTTMLMRNNPVSSGDATSDDWGSNPPSLIKWIGSLSAKGLNIEVKLIDGNVVGKTSNFPTLHMKLVVIDAEVPKSATGYVMGHNLTPGYQDKEDPEPNDSKRKPVEEHRGGYRSANKVIQTNLHDYSQRVRGSMVKDLYAEFERVWNKALAAADPAQVNDKATNPERIIDPANPTKTSYVHGAGYVDMPNWQPNPDYMPSDPDTRGTSTGSWVPIPGSKPTTMVDPMTRDEYEIPPDMRFQSNRTPLETKAADLPDDSEYAPIYCKKDEYQVTSAQFIVTSTKLAKNGKTAIREVYVNAIKNVRKYLFFDNQYFQGEDILKEALDSLDANRIAEIRQNVAFFIICNNFDMDSKGGHGLGNNSDYVDLTAGAEYSTYQYMVKKGLQFVQCNLYTKRSPHAQIYTHGKLLIADDVFATAGSANFNPRSTGLPDKSTGDLEGNIAVYDKLYVPAWRARAFKILTGSEMNEVMTEPLKVLKAWKEMAVKNYSQLGMKSTDHYGVGGLYTGTSWKAESKGDFEVGIIVDYKPNKQPPRVIPNKG